MESFGGFKCLLVWSRFSYYDCSTFFNGFSLLGVGIKWVDSWVLLELGFC